MAAGCHTSLFAFSACPVERAFLRLRIGINIKRDAETVWSLPSPGALRLAFGVRRSAFGARARARARARTLLLAAKVCQPN